MSLLDRAAMMIANVDERNGAAPWGSRWCDKEEQREKAAAAFQELSIWLKHQIENGYAPDGHPVSMTPEYELGRRSAFSAVLHLIDSTERAG